MDIQINTARNRQIDIWTVHIGTKMDRLINTEKYTDRYMNSAHWDKDGYID